MNNQARNQVRADGGVPTLPPKQAFDSTQLRFTIDNREQIDLNVVSRERVENDANINGQSDGRRQPITLEGEYNGPNGKGYYVFHSTLTQEKGSDNVEIPLWLDGTFTKSSNEEQINITDVEVLE